MKIASKTLARQLELVISLLILPNPNGFIKGRSYLDAIRTIDEIPEIGKLKNRRSILVAIDFEKAFDSLSHEFYIRSSKNGF